MKYILNKNDKVCSFACLKVVLIKGGFSVLKVKDVN